jgi:hypothetical protein
LQSVSKTLGRRVIKDVLAIKIEWSAVAGVRTVVSEPRLEVLSGQLSPETLLETTNTDNIRTLL